MLIILEDSFWQSPYSIFRLFSISTIQIIIIMIEEGRQDLENTHAQMGIEKAQPRFTQTDSSQKYGQDEKEMDLDIGFCILSVILKFLPIIFFFTTTKIKILGFTLVLASAAIDFWLTKNISGRRLVNMMWWMKVNLDTGDEEWMFMSSQGFITHHINQAIFWGCVMGGNTFWAVTLLLCIILSSLFWIALCAVCLILNVINFLFFMRCRGKHRQKFRQIADRVGLASAHSLVPFE